MCECITKLNKSLKESFKENTEVKNISLDVGFTIDFEGKQTKSYPLIQYSFEKEKKDGSLYAKKFTGNLMPTYCPFCGVKYKGV